MKFRIIGQPNDSGIGTHYQNYTNALKQIGGINQIIEFINFQPQKKASPEILI